jgi:hypothetical protein
MRFLPAFLLLLMAFIPSAANAQDDRTATSKPKAAQEDSVKDEAPEPESVKAEEKESVTAAPKKEEKAEAPVEDETKKSKVDWVAVESTGTIGSGKQGGLERTVWAKQKRSDIEFLTSRLPSAPHLRSVQSLQRRVLLSRTDFGTVDNDIGPLRGQDFLIQRIRKLMDMGLYDDAWELYAQKAESPYDVSIAQLGMTLMVMRSDAATACLELKVFAQKYPKDAFFLMLEKACSKTLGASATPSFPESKTIQAVYHEPGFKIPATSVERLKDLTDIERALVMATGKISYEGASAETLTKTPSSLLTLFLMDKALPETVRDMAVAEAHKRGIAPYMASVIKDPQMRKIKEMKDPEERWVLIESAIKTPGRNGADFKPLVDYITGSEPKNLSTDLVIRVLNVLLANGEPLNSFWIQAAEKAAIQKPIIYIYLHAFKALTPTKISSLKDEEVQKAMGRLNRQDLDQIIAIIATIDKDASYDRNEIRVYDKHLGLTLAGDYVMPSVGLNILLETASDQKQSGITVLAVLNSLAAKPDNMYSGSVRKALYSMLNVGLIEDAKTIGSEIVASVLNKY